MVWKDIPLNGTKDSYTVEASNLVLSEPIVKVKYLGKY